MRPLALALLYAASAVAQPAATDFIPANSKIVMGINLRRLIENAQLLDLKADNHSFTAAMLAQNGLAGLDPLKDVDSVVIASTGDGDQPPAIAIVRGRFANLKPVDVKDSKGIVVRVDDSIMLAGPPEMVHAAMEHTGGVLNQTLATRVAAMAARYDFWGTGGKLEGVDRFEFGALFKDGLTLDAEFHVPATQDTKKIMDALKFLEAMMHDQKFNVQVRNSAVKFSLHIPQEELKKAIVASLKPPAPPKPPSPGKIVTNESGETVSVKLPGGH